MAAYAYIKPALGGFSQGAEYIPYSLYPEAPGAVYNAGDFLANVTTGAITFPNPTPTTAGGLGLFQPTSAPTVTPAGTVSASETTHTLYAWYTYVNAAFTHESLPYIIGPIVNPPGFRATVLVPADSNYPAEVTAWNLYVGTLPGQQWQQVAHTAVGSPATIPAWPLTNNIGANRIGNNPASGLIGYAPYPSRTGYSEGVGYILNPGTQWRELFGVDQSLSGVQTLLEQYSASVVKLQNQVPVVISLLQAWNPGLIGSTAGIVYSTVYNAFYIDTTQTNAIFTITGKYGGLPGPYNLVGGQQPGVDTGVPVIGYFNGGLA